MNYIQTMMKEFNWILHCWDDRYSGGIWALLVPVPYQANEIKEITEIDFDYNQDLVEYMRGEGAWLSVEIGKNLTEVLEKLDRKVGKLTADKEFRDQVYDAFNRVITVGENLLKAVEQGDELLVKPKN